MVADEHSLKRLGEFVVARRLALRWRQSDLIRESGLSDPTVRRLEKGVPIDYQQVTIYQLCDALGWRRDSVDLILAGGEPVLAVPNLPSDEWKDLLVRVDLLEDRMAKLLRLVDEDALRSDPPEFDPDEQ